MAKKNTSVRCPKCGTEFEIPAHEVLGIVGNLIGEDSGLGDVYLKEKKGAKLKPLSERDSKGHFLSNAEKERLRSNQLRGTDEEFKNSEKYGYREERLSEKVRRGKPVKNQRLWRRWIMSQFFHILKEIEDSDGRTPFTNVIRRRGIRYMADVVINEVHDMSKILEHGDKDEFKRRLRWWDPDTVAGIAVEFVDILRSEVGKLKTHKCKGRAYKRIPGWGNVFVDEIEPKVFQPLLLGQLEVRTAALYDDVSFEKTTKKLFGLIRQFKESSAWKIRMPTKFIDAYKGAGAYFTLRNMLIYHDCRLPKAVRNGHEDLPDDWHRDCAILDDLAEQYKGAGWQLVGLVKDTLDENDMDVTEKIESWRK